MRQSSTTCWEYAPTTRSHTHSSNLFENNPLFVVKSPIQIAVPINKVFMSLPHSPVPPACPLPRAAGTPAGPSMGFHSDSRLWWRQSDAPQWKIARPIEGPNAKKPLGNHVCPWNSTYHWVGLITHSVDESSTQLFILLQICFCFLTSFKNWFWWQKTLSLILLIILPRSVFYTRNCNHSPDAI